MAAKKKNKRRIYVGAKGRLCGSFCLQLGGAAPPPTPPLFKGHRCLQKKNQRQDLCLRKRKAVRIILFATGGGCAPPSMAAKKKNKRQDLCLR